MVPGAEVLCSYSGSSGSIVSNRGAEELIVVELSEEWMVQCSTERHSAASTIGAHAV